MYCVLQEGKHVNVHVTAPGGILALGLIYLKTNNKHIAAHLAPPTTLYQFECAHLRPDFLCLRVREEEEGEGKREWY